MITCENFEAGYSWLYGEQDPSLRLDWMTIFPQSNVTIDVSLNGSEIEDPDPTATPRLKTCRDKRSFKKQISVFTGSNLMKALIPVPQSVLDTATRRCNGSDSRLPPAFTTDCCVNATINDEPGVFVSRDIFLQLRATVRPVRPTTATENTTAAPNSRGRQTSLSELPRETFCKTLPISSSPEELPIPLCEKRLQPPDTTACAPLREQAIPTGVVKDVDPRPPTPESNTRTELHDLYCTAVSC